MRAHDPAITTAPAGALKGVELASRLGEALADADAAVVCTEWPVFREAPWGELLPRMRQPLFIDANRFLEPMLRGIPGADVISVGRGPGGP